MTETTALGAAIAAARAAGVDIPILDAFQQKSTKSSFNSAVSEQGES